METKQQDPPRVVEAWRHFCDMSASPYGDRLPLKWRLHEAFVHFLLKVPWHNRWKWQLIDMIPDKVAYYTICRWAGHEEQGNPAYVTALDMMKKIAARHPAGWE